MPMSLNQLFPQAERDLLIRELTLDSRGVRPGDLFLAVPGGRQDGRAHIRIKKHKRKNLNKRYINLNKK